MKYNLTLFYLKERNQYLFQLLVISIFIIIFNLNEIVFCMEKEYIGTIMLACDGIENNIYTPEQIQALLNQINTIQDPVVLERLRQRIIIIAGQFNVDLNSYLIPQLQHPARNAEGNSGVPLEHNRDWNDIVKAILLAGTFTICAYLIFKHWLDIREALFDVGQRTLESISPAALQLTQHQLNLLLNNPASHQATVNVLVEILGNPVLPA